MPSGITCTRYADIGILGRLQIGCVWLDLAWLEGEPGPTDAVYRAWVEYVFGSLFIVKSYVNQSHLEKS